MKQWLRRVAIGVGVLAALGLVAVGGLTAWQWTFLSRALTHPERPVTDVAWYTPTDPVPGSAGPDLPIAVRPQINADVLGRVAAYAEQKKSSAFLVLHRGELVAEHY